MVGINYSFLGWKNAQYSNPFAVSSTAPIKKGRERLMASNMYPAAVGAMVLRLIRAKLLTPMAVAVSSGFTMPVAKDCRIGIANMITILNVTMRTTANGNHVVREFL